MIRSTADRSPPQTACHSQHQVAANVDGHFTDKISETNCPIPNTDIHSEKTDISTENGQPLKAFLIHQMKTAYLI